MTAWVGQTLARLLTEREHPNWSGSGGDAVEAIEDLLSIARLPPEHDPGAGCGVATAARQRWHLSIRHFGLFGGPVAAAND